MIGRSLLHYQIQSKLGEGGMGVVYRARDLRLGRDVALKVLQPDKDRDTKRRQRFLREARAAAALNHPNIVSVYDIGQDHDIDFIAMEYVPGETLHDLMRRGRLPLMDALSFARQIAGGLARAHAVGVVHRDLKPGNVMITADHQVKLLDFGLAQLNPILAADDPHAEAVTETASALTELGTAIGTLQYMSPEQARGERVDNRSDVFSFGVMLYEMLAGARPFHGASTVALMHAIVYTEPRPVEDQSGELPPGLQQLISTCLEKDRLLRFQSMDDVVSALAASASGSTPVLSGLQTNPPSTGPSPRWPLQSKNWPWLLAGLAALLALGASFAGKRPWHALLNGSLASAAHLPGETPELLRQGFAALHRFDQPGSMDRAIQIFQKALAQDPENAAAFAGLGAAYAGKHADNPDGHWLRLGRTNAGRALELNPLLADAHVSLGLVRLEERKLSEAEREFRRALDLDPNSADAQLELGESLAYQDRYPEAEQAYRRVIQAHPDDWRGYEFLASLQGRTGSYNEALSSLNQAAGLSSDNIAIYRLLGFDYHMLDRDAEAAGALQKALRIHPTPGIYTNLGIIYLYSGRYQDAVSAFHSAIEHGANDYKNWDNLGDAYRFIPGNESQAQDAYRQAIRLVQQQLAGNPDSGEMRSRLAVYLAKSGNTPASQAEIEHAARAPKLDAASLFQLGLASELTGRRSQSLKFLSRAVQAGFSIKTVTTDPDLVALRQDPGYHLVVLAQASNGGK